MLTLAAIVIKFELYLNTTIDRADHLHLLTFTVENIPFILVYKDVIGEYYMKVEILVKLLKEKENYLKRIFSLVGKKMRFLLVDKFI